MPEQVVSFTHAELAALHARLATRCPVGDLYSDADARSVEEKIKLAFGKAEVMRAAFIAADNGGTEVRVEKWKGYWVICDNRHSFYAGRSKFVPLFEDASTWSKKKLAVRRAESLGFKIVRRFS